MLKEVVRKQFPLLVFSRYISPPLAEKLRENGIWFADMCGNVFIEIPGKFLVFVKGNKLRNEGYGDSFPLISRGGAHVYLFFLVEGPEVKMNYREIASHCGVSLGSLVKIIGGLKKAKVISGERSHYRVEHPSFLLELWVRSYLEKLKPFCFTGRFTWKHGSNFRNLFEVRDISFGIGGEFGGEVLTEYLRASSVNLWVRDEDMEHLRRYLGLMRSREGNIFVFRFPGIHVFQYKKKKYGKIFLVSPPVIYADLLEKEDPRTFETAEILRRRFMKWTLS